MHAIAQVNKSEAGRVLIEETNGKTTGKYKCEISIEGTFQTVAAEKLMTVLGNFIELLIEFLS